eukprot:gb/GECH01003959.1/.p1 GENE.gb/GECH01003959.1/~~gb/GECH01003959.1/.p1  ORF type:complete len:345 (+),score=40.65 gb/GECH01003959.1/:1-1035(+)
MNNFTGIFNSDSTESEQDFDLGDIDFPEFKFEEEPYSLNLGELDHPLNYHIDPIMDLEVISYPSEENNVIKQLFNYRQLESIENKQRPLLRLVDPLLDDPSFMEQIMSHILTLYFTREVLLASSKERDIISDIPSERVSMYYTRIRNCFFSKQTPNLKAQNLEVRQKIDNIIEFTKNSRHSLLTELKNNNSSLCFNGFENPEFQKKLAETNVALLKLFSKAIIHHLPPSKVLKKAFSCGILEELKTNADIFRIPSDYQSICKNEVKNQSQSKANTKARISKRAREILEDWFRKNWNHPYPNKDDKNQLCQSTGLSKRQLNNWFTNMRVRVWIPQRKSASHDSGE